MKCCLINTCFINLSFFSVALKSLACDKNVTKICDKFIFIQGEYTIPKCGGMYQVVNYLKF